MKKLLALALVVVLILACTTTAFAATKTGLGIVTYTNASRSASERDGEPVNGRAQVDSTICAVTIDENNVVIAISFDVAQTRVVFNAEGQIESDLTVTTPSKRERGFDYNMLWVSAERGTNDGVGFELFEQLDHLEAYCIGKTVDQVLNIRTEKYDDDHLFVPADEDLKSLVTITIGEFLEAFAKAVENAK